MADEVLGSASIVIDLDDADAVAEAERLGDRIERALNRASRDAGARMARNITRAIRRISPAVIRVEADTEAFQRAVSNLNNLGRTPLSVVPDVDRPQFEGAVQAALAGLEVSVRVVPDLDDFDARIRAHRPPDVTVRVDIDTDRFNQALAGLSRAASATGGALAGALRFGAIGIAAAGAVQGVAALTAALAPAAGAIAALPALFAGAKLAMGTFRLATAGVGDALKALAEGDTKKFEKALKSLSPAAREALRTLQGLEPQLRKVQQSIQDRFFEQFGQDIKGAVTNLAPLSQGLQGIAEDFGAAVSHALRFGASAEALDRALVLIEGTRQALTGLPGAVQPVLKGFLDVAAAVSQAFGPRLAVGIAAAGERLGAFLTRLADTGRAVSLVEGALSVFRQIGAIASNVGGILSGVFAAADQAGGGLLANLERLTAQLEAFVTSARGQTALSGIFTALSAAAAQLGPILAAVVTQLGGLAPAIGRALSGIGPVIADLVNSLGEGLRGALPDLEGTFANLVTTLAALAPALPPVVAALASLAKSASDLLVPLAPLVSLLAQVVAPVVELASPVLVAAAAFVALVKAVQLALTVVPLVQAAWAALNAVFIASPIGVITAAVVALGVAVFLLYQRFQPVRDVVDGVGNALRTAFQSTVSFVQGAITAVSDFASAVGTFFTGLPGQISTALSSLGAFFTALPGQATAALSSLGAAVLAGLAAAGSAITSFLASLPSLVLSGLLSLATTFTVGLAFSLGAITSFVLAAVNFFSTLPERITSALVTLGATLVLAFTNAFTAVSTFITGAVDSLVSFFTALPGRISAALAALPGLVRGVFTSAGTAATSTVTSTVNSVTSFFASLPGRVRSAVSSLTGVLSSVFNSARAAVISSVTSTVAEAIALLRSLPGRARSALGNLGSVLAGAGRELVQGFANGIASAAGRVLSAARSLVDRAKSAFTAGLRIFSPSRVTRQYGEFVGQGFVQGILGTQDQVKAAAEQLVSKIQDAFKGRNTRVDDRLISLIQASSKRLQALAQQREAIAARIKAANELAVSTTQAALQSFSLANIAQQGGGVAGLQNGLDAAQKAVRKFNSQINELARRGLRKDLLSQIIGLGPQQGSALASTLATATAAQLKDLNEAQKALSDAAKKLGQDSADNLFDAGKKASEGFLAGLKAQQTDIERLMVTIARGLTTAIKRALGIRSPSKVFAEIGRFTMAGLDQGLRDSLKAPLSTSRAAAQAILDPFGGRAAPAGFRSVTGPYAGSLSRGTSGQGAGRTIHNTFNISAVGDGEATARRVLNRLAMAGGGL